MSLITRYTKPISTLIIPARIDMSQNPKKLKILEVSCKFNRFSIFCLFINISHHLRSKLFTDPKWPPRSRKKILLTKIFSIRKSCWLHSLVYEETQEQRSKKKVRKARMFLIYLLISSEQSQQYRSWLNGRMLK